MPIEPTSELVFSTRLSVDGLAFQAAERALKRAERAHERVARAQFRCDRLSAALDRIEAASRGADVDRAEPIAHRLEDAEDRLARAYAPLLQATATVHVMAAVCIEAHVNVVAKWLLPGAEYDMFERFSLEAKWLTLPKLLGLDGFATGEQPMQGVVRLARLRNALVHYKDRHEPWAPPGVPSFLDKLGLTVAAARESLVTGRDAIHALAKRTGMVPPLWLLHRGSHYFEMWGTGRQASDAPEQPGTWVTP